MSRKNQKHNGIVIRPTDSITKTVSQSAQQVQKSMLESECGSDDELEEIYNAFQQYHTIFMDQRKTMIEQKNKLKVMETAAKLRVGELKKELEDREKKIKDHNLHNKLIEQELEMYKNKEMKRANSVQKENILQSLIKLTELKQKTIDDELITDSAIQEEALKCKFMFD